MVYKPRYYNIDNDKYDAILYLKYTDDSEKPRTFREIMQYFNIFAYLYNLIGFGIRKRKNRNDINASSIAYKAI